MPKSSNFKRESTIPNLPPVDACITYRDENSLAENFIAIEIQGAGHYLDDNGEYHNGKHLLKIGRLQKAGIKVIEINGCKISNFHNSKKIAAYLIDILSKNHVEIRPEYKDNIPQLLQDAGITP
jgi:predicted N-formylglutamate amidohydrolase